MKSNRPPTTIIGIPITAPTNVKQRRVPRIANNRPIVFLIGFKYKAKANKIIPMSATKVSI